MLDPRRRCGADSRALAWAKGSTARAGGSPQWLLQTPVRVCAGSTERSARSPPSVPCASSRQRLRKSIPRSTSHAPIGPSCGSGRRATRHSTGSECPASDLAGSVDSRFSRIASRNSSDATRVPSRRSSLTSPQRGGFSASITRPVISDPCVPVPISAVNPRASPSDCPGNDRLSLQPAAPRPPRHGCLQPALPSVVPASWVRTPHRPLGLLNPARAGVGLEVRVEHLADPARKQYGHGIAHLPRHGVKPP